VPTKPPTHRRSKQPQPSRSRYERGSSAARGYGAAWQRIRESVLLNEPLCRECCLHGITTAATEVDHIRAKAAGGTDDRDNLQPLCKTCHSRKTAREDGGYGRKPR
jgi:5-methylcytosine-specific restriction protein A